MDILILILGLALIGYVFGVENREPDENDKRRDRERFERKHERWAHSRGPRLPDEERERHDAFLAQERERADARHSD
jgi:hypothetical protein